MARLNLAHGTHEYHRLGCPAGPAAAGAAAATPCSACPRPPTHPLKTSDTCLERRGVVDRIRKLNKEKGFSVAIMVGVRVAVRCGVRTVGDRAVGCPHPPPTTRCPSPAALTRWTPRAARCTSATCLRPCKPVRGKSLYSPCATPPPAAATASRSGAPHTSYTRTGVDGCCGGAAAASGVLSSTHACVQAVAACARHPLPGALPCRSDTPCHLASCSAVQPCLQLRRFFRGHAGGGHAGGGRRHGQPGGGQQGGARRGGARGGPRWAHTV